MGILQAHTGTRVYRVNTFMTQHKGLSVCPTTHPIPFLPICSLVANSLEYFLVLTSEMHRDSWVPVLLLCFTKMLQLNELQVRPWASHRKMSVPLTCTCTCMWSAGSFK